MAGLQPVGAGHVVEQRIAVALLDVVVGEAQLRIEVIVLREVLDGVLDQGRQVAHRGQVIWVRPARGVAELGVGHAELVGLFGHLAAKASSEPARPSAKTTAASLPDCTMTPWIRSSTLTLVPTSTNIFEPPMRQAFSLTGSVSSSVSVPSARCVEDQVHRHHLGHRRRMGQLVGVLLEQHGAGVLVDQDRPVARRCIERPAVASTARPGGREP